MLKELRIFSAVVELLDISKLDNERFRELGFHTPICNPRHKLDFDDVPVTIREELAAPLKQLMESSKKDNNISNNPFVEENAVSLFKSGKIEGVFARENVPNSINNGIQVAGSNSNNILVGSNTTTPEKDTNPELDTLIDRIIQRRDELVSKNDITVVES